MKIKTKTEKAPFTPVTITVTFEREEELADLWHRLNISQASVKRVVKEGAGRPPLPDYTPTFALWKAVDRLLEQGDN